MKHIISSTALVMALSMTPALAAANNFGGQETAHERCKRDEDKRQVLGGLAGAVAGGIFGSQVSGNGARTEGSAIGAVLGGLAGVGIADKTIDCDPVYDNDVRQSSVGSYPAGSYPTESYPTSSTTYGGGTQSYGSTTYGSSPQPIYEERITVSDHPVYSNPSYGAGSVSQDTTYSSGTVSYPPSGNNSQYASQTYSAPSYGSSTAYQSTPTYDTLPVYDSAPVYDSGSVYDSAPIYTNTTQGARDLTTSGPIYSQSRTVAQPVYRSAPQPVYRTGQSSPRRGGLHRHGRYSCDMIH